MKKIFLTKSICLLIILFVCTFTLAISILIVHKAIVSNESNYHLVKGYMNGEPVVFGNPYNNFGKVFSFVFRPDVVLSATSNKPQIVAPTPADCPVPFHVLASWYRGSLVDYLEAQGYDYSFSARERYAREFNITGYDGSYAQNQIMLMNFFVKLGQIPAFENVACATGAVSINYKEGVGK